MLLDNIYIYIYIYISSVYSPFSDRVGLPLHKKRIGAEFLKDLMPFLASTHAWDAVSNSSKYCILSETQPIQLNKFVCTILHTILYRILILFELKICQENVCMNVNQIMISSEERYSVFTFLPSRNAET